MDTVFASVYEMMQYASLLQCAPHCAGGLLCLDNESGSNDGIKRILEQMREEWIVVLTMESSTGSAATLNTFCPHTKHQVYRELQGALESTGYKITQDVRDLATAWFPMACSSSLVEDVFASMADSVKRGSKRETASLAGLQAVAVRSTIQRCNRDDDSEKLTAVHLESADHEGNEVRGLRSNIWRPESAPSSFLSERWYKKHLAAIFILNMHVVTLGVIVRQLSCFLPYR